jgi:hypothetical protein
MDRSAAPRPAPRSRTRTVMIVLLAILAAPFLLVGLLASLNRSR